MKLIEIAKICVIFILIIASSVFAYKRPSTSENLDIEQITTTMKASAAGSSASAPVQMETIVFLDFETTGLKDPWITEMAMWLISRNELLGGSKNQRSMLYKWTMPFNPEAPIDPAASAITGLDNHLLSQYKEFNNETGRIILSFLDHFPKPICILAHNGKRFDFRVLKKSFDHIQMALPETIYCADTMDIFRKIQTPPPINTSEKTKKPRLSFSLIQIYNRVFDTPPAVTHQAEADVEIMYKLAKFYGEDFVKYVDEFAKPLTEIKGR